LEKNGNIARTFARLFSSPGTLATCAVLFGFYWVVFYELVRYAGQGYFLVAAPLSLLVLFVLSSSVLATISIAYLRLAARRRRGAVGVAQSPLMVAAGTAVVTCACNLPLLAPLLYSIGMNSLSVSAVISSFARFQEPLVLAMTGLNALSACYYLKLLGAVQRGAGRAPPAHSLEVVVVGENGSLGAGGLPSQDSRNPVD
jgi:hypothetical protein